MSVIYETIKADLLSEKEIRLCLNGPQKNSPIYIFQTLASTNKTAKKLASEGTPHGTLVLAEEQTAGRGRMGRSFFSPPGTGLYMSVVLRPEVTAADALLLTSTGAVAVCRAIEKITCKHCTIKWVNDIFYEGKKVCGILTETGAIIGSGIGNAIVMGIGINFCRPEDEFPAELRETAGVLFENRSEDFTISTLAGEIAKGLLTLCIDLKHNDYKGYLDEYKSRSTILGKKIKVLKKGIAYPAVALDIDELGGLIIKNDRGVLETLRSGEITIWRKDD